MGGPDAYTRPTMGNFYFIVSLVSLRVLIIYLLSSLCWISSIFHFHARGDILVSIQTALLFYYFLLGLCVIALYS